MPSLEKLNQIFKNDKFVLLGIDIGENRDTVLSQVQQYGLTFDNLLDETGEVSAGYAVRSTPVKFIIDAKGNLIGFSLGYNEWDSNEMQSLIRRLMEAG